MDYYAHSGVPEKSLLPQRYEDHVRNVCMLGESHAKSLFKEQYLVDAVVLACLYHDIGKLHSESQEVLSGKLVKDHLVNHVDAGVAYLVGQYTLTKNTVYALAAWLVHAHHRGLEDLQTIFKVSEKKVFGGSEKEYAFLEDDIRDENVRNIMDTEIDSYVTISRNLVPEWHNRAIAVGSTFPNAVHVRMMLSCLVDADHNDTGNHYSGFKNKPLMMQLNAEKKISTLDAYIDTLKSYGSMARQEARKMLLEANRNIDTSHSFYCVDSPVGTGKTFSVLRGALEIAKARNSERIFTILPFTNVISQTVEEYRKGMDVSDWQVAEIHSKVEFESFRLRHFNNSWNAPISVSTAVQFFESLWSNHPVALRKYKQFANSVIVIDEFHSAIPHDYWKVALTIMKDMAKQFNTVFIFCSGTCARYWRIFDDVDVKVHEVLPVNTYEHLQQEEMKRVRKIDIGLVTLDELVDQISPRKSVLSVFNTVKNALTAAQAIPKAYYISSAMTPVHREKVIREVKDGLKNKKKIKVVSTSILECGHDISFDSGFREWCGVNSIMQCGGRINRGCLVKNATLSMFDLDGDFTSNPSIRRATEIAREYDAAVLSPEDCTEAIDSEINKNKAQSYYTMEKNLEMKKLSELRVINSNTYTIVCDTAAVHKIKNGEVLSPQEVNRVSVQVWENNLEKLSDRVIHLDKRIYGMLDDHYDRKFGVVV